ncbi:expressed unknown protein [Seminavis robusta]|uniref:Uncharacterized protein n=1 Tax=Seminavis robusta TaxID=568900 RepID=A0A9N8E8R3_9STRA|nr:expressed unknown protein [Seminavis robusta]|eukprot:Sro748_g196670.1 n/a (581) ;mRNA; f:18394-20136
MRKFETYRVAAPQEDENLQESTWGCSFWSLFDRNEKEIVPVPSEDAYSFPECDYDQNPTNLYKQIEAKNWKGVNHYLLTGYWSGSFFADGTPPREQACTWVTKYDLQVTTKKRKVVWTHLPIHAAITHGAPEGTISIMVKIAPPTLRCADENRMLPLHLAFRRGCPDAMIATIMSVFPEGCAVRDQLGRTPAECAAEGPNKNRGTIIQTVLHYNQRAWEKKAAKIQEDQLRNVRSSLLNRNERIDHLKTALKLIRSREDQTRDSFALIVAELRKIKMWYDENERNLCSEEEELRRKVVQALSAKLTYLGATAEEMRTQMKKNQRSSEKSLADLNAICGAGSDLSDMAFRNFDELMKVDSIRKVELMASDESSEATEDQERSLGASVAKSPSLLTDADKSKALSKTLSKQSLHKAQESELKKLLREKEQEDLKFVDAAIETARKVAHETEDEKKEEVPHVVSAPTTTEGGAAPTDVGIDRVISEMTSYDMSEAGSYLSSKVRSFRKSLKTISKGNDSAKKSKKAADASKLPPKPPSLRLIGTPASKTIEKIEKGRRALEKELEKQQKEKSSGVKVSPAALL